MAFLLFCKIDRIVWSIYKYRNDKLSTMTQHDGWMRVMAKVTKIERCEICRNDGSEIVNLILLPHWVIFSAFNTGKKLAKILQTLCVNMIPQISSEFCRCERAQWHCAHHHLHPLTSRRISSFTCILGKSNSYIFGN